MKEKLQRAFEDAAAFSIRWLIPSMILFAGYGWIVYDYSQTRAKAHATYEFLQRVVQQQQQAKPAETPAK